MLQPCGKAVYNRDMRNLNWLFPLGFFGFGFAETLLTQWVVYFHNPPDGVASSLGAWIGSLLLLSFLLQGILNPFLGYFTDRIRHPMGRRRPMILLLSVPMALAFGSIWLTRSPMWSLLSICGFGLLFVGVVQPYVTLLPSLTHTPEQRIRYSLGSGFFSLLASGCALIGGPWMVDQFGFIGLGIAGALGILVTLFIPAVFLQEDLSNLPELSQNHGFSDFLSQMQDVLKDRAFVWFLASNAGLILVILSMTIALPYLCIELLQQERSYTSILNGFVFIGVALAIGYTQIKGSQLSFLKLLKQLCLLNLSVLGTLTLLSFLGPVPLVVWWVGFVSMGALVLVAMMSPHIVISQMTEQDGQKREGAFFGLNGLALNGANALASQVTALLLGLSAWQTGFGVQAVLIFALMALGLCLWTLTQAQKHGTY